MNLSAYLARIGHKGPAHADLATLAALQRAHVNAIPFENLDVQLGIPVALDAKHAFDKLVTRRRGGWCYEMNRLMGWALEEIGFKVTRLSAGVMRETGGDETFGGHLCLLVSLDRDYLVDAGFGGSLTAPLPLEDHARDDAPYAITLRRADGEHWRFTEIQNGEDFSFDFAARPADKAQLAAKCAFQQTDPASPFVKNLVAQIRDGETHWTLRGRVLTRTTPAGVERTRLNAAAELVAALDMHFGLDVPEAARLWPAICERHAELFGDDA